MGCTLTTVSAHDIAPSLSSVPMSAHACAVCVGLRGVCVCADDNILFQIAGSKRALLFPPQDSSHLYYASEGVNIRRHAFSLEAGFANETLHEALRKNVA